MLAAFSSRVWYLVALEYVGMLMQCLETMVVVWMKMFPNQNGRTKRWFPGENDGWIFATPKWEWLPQQADLKKLPAR